MTSKPIAATASSRSAAVRRVPLVTVPVSGSAVAPSERGKNSYQLPNSARCRSTKNGCSPSLLSRSRSGLVVDELAQPRVGGDGQPGLDRA